MCEIIAAEAAPTIEVFIFFRKTIASGDGTLKK